MCVITNVVVIPITTEFERFGTNCPFGWIPTDWLHAHPHLNCDVYMVLANQCDVLDNGQYIDMLSLKASQPHSRWKRIDLSAITLSDFQLCTQTWAESSCKFDKDLKDKFEETIPSIHLKDGNLYHIRLLYFLCKADPSNLNKPKWMNQTLTQHLNDFFELADQNFGGERVAFFINHFLASRWGLRFEDIMGLEHLRQISEGGIRRKSQVNQQQGQRFSMQFQTMRSTFKMMNTNQSVNCNWLCTFDRTYLRLVTLLRPRLDADVGNSPLWYIRHMFIRDFLKTRYHYADNKMTMHNLQATGYRHTSRKCETSIGTDADLVKRNWRWVNELPLQLIETNQRKRIKEVCLCSFDWWEAILRGSFQQHGIQFGTVWLMNQVLYILSRLLPDRDNREIHQMVQINEQYKTLLSHNREVLHIVCSLHRWRDYLKQDMDLFGSLLYNECLKFLKEGAENLPDKTLNDTVFQRIIACIIKKPDVKLLKSLNFSEIIHDCCYDEVLEELLSDPMDGDSLTLSQSNLLITTMAYSPNRRYLAIGIKNTKQSAVVLEVWDLHSYAHSCFWNHTISVGMNNQLTELRWVSNKAILGFQVVSDNPSIWSLQSCDLTNSVQCYNLSCQGNQKSVQHSVEGHELVEVVTTSEDDVVWIVLLSKGKSALTIWLWNKGVVQLLLENYDYQVILDAHLEKDSSLDTSWSKDRQLLNKVMLSSGFDSKNLHVIIAKKTSSVACQLSFPLLKETWILGKDQLPPEFHILRCSDSLTRVYGATMSRKGDLIALAGRCPMREDTENNIIGSIDLFNSEKSTFLARIEGTSSVFASIDDQNKSKQINRIVMNMTNDGTYILTSTTSPMDPSASQKVDSNTHFNLGSIDFVLWNVDSRLCMPITPEMLFPHLQLNPMGTSSSLVGTCLAVRDESRLSIATTSRTISEPTRIIHVDPIRAFSMPHKPQKRQRYEGTLVEIYSDQKDVNKLTYLYQDELGKTHIGMYVFSPNTLEADADAIKNSITELTTELLPKERETFDTKGKYILNGSNLVVLSKLERSEQVQQCR